MNKTVKKLIVAGSVAAAAAAAVAAATAVVTEKLMDMALDREAPKMPKGMGRLAGTGGAAPDMDAVRAAAKRLEERGGETVFIAARDGVCLAGHWFEAPDAKRVIIAMHGWRSCWSQDFSMVADFWLSCGCSILFAEQRAQNASGGDYMGFGLLERYDCLDWVNYVNKRTGASLPLYLSGISMGGTTVLMAAGLDLPENVRGITADCAFTSPKDIWRHVAEKNLHVPYWLYGTAVDRICRRKIQSDAGGCSTLDAMRRCKVPVMFIHGTEDSFVPVEMTYENYKACAAPKTLFIVPGAGHGMSYVLEPERYHEEVQRFWQQCENAEE